METLFKNTTELSPVDRSTCNGPIQITRRHLQLKCTGWKKDYPSRPDKGLDSTYRRKPLYECNGELLYGELAVIRLLEADGWEAVWTDNFHNRGPSKRFWRGIPTEGLKCIPDEAARRYSEIVQKNGGSKGFFDVFAWRKDTSDYIYIECKKKGESANKNEKPWIRAVVPSIVKPEELLFVVIGCSNGNH